MAETAQRKVIDKKYRLLSKLGEGAMGIVSLAEQLDVEGRVLRQVAFKTIRREYSTNPDFARRFLREVRVAMQLRNPHTVTVHDSGRGEDGQLYSVMEFINGPTLKQVLQKQKSLPVPRAVALISQICEALAEAHSLPEPVIHRDLKPANIFLEQRQGQEWAKIGDFGIAKVLGEHTMAITQLGQSSPGTPRYMAPELWTGDAEGSYTDLYALGVMFYEMLTGTPPFTAPTLEALMHHHLHTPPPALPATIPAGIRMQVERLLAKAPQDRPSNARNVRLAVEAALKDDEQPTIRRGRDERSASLGEQSDKREILPLPPPQSWWRRSLPVIAVTGFILFLGLFLWHPWSRVMQSEKAAANGQLTSRTTPLALRLAVMKRRNNLVSVLKEGEELTAGDYYGVFFEPAQASFVYVLQQDATGKIDVLFPDSKVTPQTNPVSAKQAVWVPKDEQHWFYLDKHTGREVIFVVASSQRDDKLETFLQHLDDTQTQGALAQWITSPERGRGGVKQFKTEARLSPGGTRMDLETTLVQGSSADFLYKVTFQHK